MTNDEIGERGRLTHSFRRPRRKASRWCPARRVTQRARRPRSPVRHFLQRFLQPSSRGCGTTAWQATSRLRRARARRALGMTRMGCRFGLLTFHAPSILTGLHTRNRHTCSSTRITRSIGIRGAKKRSPKRVEKINRSFCRLVIPRATGATSWRTNLSKAKKQLQS